jgi:hypothetical protein
MTKVSESESEPEEKKPEKKVAPTKKKMEPAKKSGGTGDKPSIKNGYSKMSGHRKG